LTGGGLCLRHASQSPTTTQTRQNAATITLQSTRGPPKPSATDAMSLARFTPPMVTLSVKM
jgi:hypothetical protein